MTATRSVEECASRLLRLLTAQGGIFAQVRERAEKLSSLIDTGDTDGLMRVLAEKQRLISQNDQLKAELDPWLEVWERTRNEATPGLRAPIEAALEALRGHMVAIFEMEEAAKQRLEGVKSETGSQASKVQTGKAMLRAYGQRPGGAAGVVDQQAGNREAVNPSFRNHGDGAGFNRVGGVGAPVLPRAGHGDENIARPATPAVEANTEIGRAHV